MLARAWHVLQRSLRDNRVVVDCIDRALAVSALIVMFVIFHLDGLSLHAAFLQQLLEV